MPERTPFDILGVAPDAEPEVITAAYRALAKKYHPDVIGAGASQARMRELNWARDELQRDLAGWRARVAQPPPPPRGRTASAPPRPPTKQEGAQRRTRRTESLGVTVQPSFIFLEGRRGASATVKAYADDVPRGAITARFRRGVIDVTRAEDNASGSTFLVTVVADLPADAPGPTVERVSFRAPGNAGAVVRITVTPVQHA